MKKRLRKKFRWGWHLCKRGGMPQHLSRMMNLMHKTIRHIKSAKKKGIDADTWFWDNYLECLKAFTKKKGLWNGK